MLSGKRSLLDAQPSCFLKMMNLQIQSEFFFSNVLMSFLKITVGGLPKNMFLLVILISKYLL